MARRYRYPTDMITRIKPEEVDHGFQTTADRAGSGVIKVVIDETG